MKHFIPLMLVLLYLVGCSTNPEDTSPVNPPVSTSKAYVAFRLSNEALNTTRAIIETGSPEESKITSSVALMFAGNLCVDVIEVTGGTIGSETIEATASEAVAVDDRSTHAFVMVNARNTPWDAITAIGKTWEEINQLKTLSATSITEDNNFAMANAGTYPDGPLVAVTLVKSGPNMNDDQAKEEARKKGVAAEIRVDRLSSKVTCDIAGSFKTQPTGALFSFEGWELNVTNKSSYLYSDLEQLTATGASGIYRKDGNYELSDFPAIEKEPAKRTSDEKNVLAERLRQHFNFLENKGGTIQSTSEVARKKGSSAYCLENTMTALAQKKGITTKIVVKGKYTPKEIASAGTKSYFSWKGKYYTLEQIKTAYQEAIKTSRNSGLGKYLPEFLRATQVQGIETADTNNKLDMLVSGLTGSSFNKESGIVARYMPIRYFHESVCYYDILIRHDQGISELMALGRYGVVRNNWYTLILNGVSGPGTPWIPNPADPNDPTDPGIDDEKKDDPDIPDNPDNPDTPDQPDIPDNPDTPEDPNVVISVSISVRPWSIKNYITDL